MSKVNDGGPALVGLEVSGGFVRLTSQLTLRDYFAAKAMSAYVNSELLMASNTDEECVLQFINVAAFSYRLADAMLEARDK